MHELGVLTKAVQTVDNVAKQNNIPKIKHMTLEVGVDSSFVPIFFEKLFPVAIEQYPRLQGAQLRLESVPGTGLVIKEIGY